MENKTDTAANRNRANLSQPSSIANKLNGRLFFRLLGIFIALDVFLCILFGAGLIIYAEMAAADLASEISAVGLENATENLLTTREISFEKVDYRPSDGFTYPDVIQKYLPEESAAGVRSIGFSQDYLTAVNRLEGAEFKLWVSMDGATCQITVYFKTAIAVFWRALVILFMYELIVLLSKTISNARTIRKTLAPISELAATARSLQQSSFAIDELSNLAGTLDGINAAKLGTRIDASQTQDELKTLAYAINSMLDRINEAYRAQTRFVADASHELRTPISVVQGYANLLDRWGKNDEKTLQESIDAIKDEANAMKELVERLLFLARGDANNMIVKMERLNLSALTAETLRETRMIDKGHEYSSDINEAYITGDEGLIKQALRILIDNAIKYTDSGGQIAISVSQENGLARLQVQDEGIGIASDAVPHIFDRFYRADDSRARATGGTGLGLSIAKWIVDRHGGHLEVLSREGLGTRVSIMLPMLELPKADNAQ